MEFSSATLDKIRDTVRISDVVSKKVKLQKKGKDFFGLCPFHSEKSPSFSVNDTKNFYHCFGCGAHGNAIKFVQETQNLKFVEAVKFLAAEYNIQIIQVAKDQVDRSNRVKVFGINRAAAEWFHKNLSSQGATQIIHYLNKRGIETKAINKFCLGYAPANARLLINHLVALGYTREEMLESGIASEKNNELFCRFRNRVMFPINNLSGEVIAFGGRVVSDKDSPKYLNSPETLVFQKRNSLYLEDVAFKGVKDSDTIFVVEGYIDAMAINSIGLTNTVATLGTAISDLHLKKLWNRVYTPTICMDGDAPGVTAANKVMAVALPLLKPGYSLKFIKLPKGYDPDALIRTHGATYFKDLASKAVPLSEIIWDTCVSKVNLEIPENKALLKQRLLGLADTIEDLSIRDFYKKYFLEKLSNLSPKYYSKKGKDASKPKIEQPKPVGRQLIENLSTLQRYEFTLAAILITTPELLKNAAVFEKFTSITPKTKALDSTYIAVLNSFTETESATGEDFSVDEFQQRMKSYVTEVFFDYLCGNSSYFIDTISIKTHDGAFELWCSTFERYNLELMKEEYKVLLKGFDTRSLEMAVKLKREIEISESKIKTHSMNREN